MRIQVSLATSILRHHRRRLLLYACGVALSVLIMFTEIGFYNGLNDSQAMLPPLLNADLVMVHKQRTHLLNNTRFDKVRLAMISAMEDVAETVPLYEGFTVIRHTQTRRPRKIYVYAFPPGTHALHIPALNQIELQIHPPGTIIFDQLARPIYGRIETGMDVTLELSKPHRVAGVIALGPNISYDGYLFMSDRTWMALDNSDAISMGLIRVDDGTDVIKLKYRAKDLLPEDVVLLTPEELRRREVDFTVSASASGMIFGVGLVMGMVVGVVICYQILFQIIMDHLPQYAVMSAMGFTVRFITATVIQQAFILTIAGFIPGLIGAAVLYATVEHYTHIIMTLTTGRIAFVFLLTALTATAGGLLAARRLRTVNPADLY